MLTAVPLFCSMHVICIIYKKWLLMMNLCGLNYLVESSQSWWVAVFLILWKSAFCLCGVFTNQHQISSIVHDYAIEPLAVGSLICIG